MAATNNLPEIAVFTDGACLGNPGPGGWAYILRDPKGNARKRSGGEKETTNNRMELTALIYALNVLKQPCRLELISDSEYLVKGINEWLAGWKQRDWRKSDKKAVQNADLWKQIDELIEKHQVEARWTRGHDGHKENEECDRMANAEAQKLAEGDGGGSAGAVDDDDAIELAEPDETAEPVAPATETSADESISPAEPEQAPIACPGCGGQRLQPGRLMGSKELVFHPTNAKFIGEKSNLKVHGHVCPDCGLIVLRSDPENIAKKLQISE